MSNEVGQILSDINYVIEPHSKQCHAGFIISLQVSGIYSAPPKYIWEYSNDKSAWMPAKSKRKCGSRH